MKGVAKKGVASYRERRDCRHAMRQRALSRGFAALATAAFVWTLILSVSPDLHGQIHADQNRADHSCAVTFVQSGSFHHAPVASPGIANNSVADFATIPQLTPHWVPCPFLTASVFEHGPPFIS